MEGSKEEQALTDAGAILGASIKWWKVKANICMGELQVLEKKFLRGNATEEDMARYDQLMVESQYIIAKGHLEWSESNNFEKKCRDFYRDYFAGN